MSHIESQKLNQGRTLGGFASDELWLDHMEGELDRNLEKDLAYLLKNSPFDRKRLERLWRARDLIKESDEVLLPEDAREYDRMHDQIMNALENVEQEEIKPTAESRMSWTLALLAALAPSFSKRYSIKA